MNTLIETYDPEKDGIDFDRPIIRTEEGPTTLQAPRLPFYCPRFVFQALGYAAPTIERVSGFVGVHHGPAGITINDGAIEIETGYEEPAASSRAAVLRAWLESYPMCEAMRGQNIGDGEIPAHRCSVITVDQLNGNLWILPFDVAMLLLSSNEEIIDFDDITESQAVDLFYSWLSGEIS